MLFAQMSIKGKVIDKVTQDPLPGVNIVVKGTTNGVVTDFDGIYTINNIKTGDILVFSFIGYKPIEISVDSNADINVSLE